MAMEQGSRAFQCVLTLVSCAYISCLAKRNWNLPASASCSFFFSSTVAHDQVKVALRHQYRC